MSRATYPLKLPVSIKEAAARLAQADGVSLNQWIVSAVAQKVGTMENAADYLKRRAGSATGDGFSAFLDSVLPAPAASGDEIQSR